MIFLLLCGSSGVVSAIAIASAFSAASLAAVTATHVTHVSSEQMSDEAAYSLSPTSELPDTQPSRSEQVNAPQLPRTSIGIDSIPASALAVKPKTKSKRVAAKMSSPDHSAIESQDTLPKSPPATKVNRSKKN